MSKSFMLFKVLKAKDFNVDVCFVVLKLYNNSTQRRRHQQLIKRMYL